MDTIQRVFIDGVIIDITENPQEDSKLINKGKERYNFILEKLDDKVPPFQIYGITFSEADMVCYKKGLYYKLTGICCEYCKNTHTDNLHILNFYKKTYKTILRKLIGCYFC